MPNQNLLYLIYAKNWRMDTTENLFNITLKDKGTCDLVRNELEKVLSKEFSYKENKGNYLPYSIELSEDEGNKIESYLKNNPKYELDIKDFIKNMDKFRIEGSGVDRKGFSIDIRDDSMLEVVKEKIKNMGVELLDKARFNNSKPLKYNNQPLADTFKLDDGGILRLNGKAYESVCKNLGISNREIT